jgi:hypothetical protein
MKDLDLPVGTKNEVQRKTFEICFPCGLKIEEDLGRGKIVRIRVEELGIA